MFYTPETLGPHRISFLVTDNYGQEVGPVEIDLEAKQLELEFNASANSNEVLVGQRGTISLSLIEKGDYSDVAYELNYFISGGEAQLYNGNSPIVPSQYFTVRPGSFAYDFIAQEAGTYEITFLLRDSNGQILEEKVTVVVGNNDFTVSMTPSKATEFSNIPVGIIVDIDEVPEGANDSYTAFFSSSQNGAMSVNGVTYGPGKSSNWVRESIISRIQDLNPASTISFLASNPVRMLPERPAPPSRMTKWILPLRRVPKNRT